MRGVHNTILDLQRIVNAPIKPTIIHLTETKHSQIKFIWREGVRRAAASDRGFGVNPRLPRNRRKFPHLLVVGARNSGDLGPAGFG
jgi:hypothetical protein